MSMRTTLLLLLVVLLLHPSSAQSLSLPSQPTINAAYAPSPPMADVPFIVTFPANGMGSDFSGKFMFASVNEQCSASIGDSSKCRINVNDDTRSLGNNKCNFTITRNDIKNSTDVGVTITDTMKKVYLCVQDTPASKSILHKEELPLATIRIWPHYVRTRRDSNVMTFSDSTPIGTEVGFNISMNEPTSYTKLNSSRTFKIDVTNAPYATQFFLYTKIPLGDGSLSDAVYQYWLWGVQNFSWEKPTVAVQYMNITMNISGPSMENAHYMLSNTSDCRVVSQDIISNQNRLQVVLRPVNVSAGNYTLCVNNTANPVIYAPTEIELQVSQYHFYPQGVYANMSTALQLYVENGVANSTSVYWAYINDSQACDSVPSGSTWTKSGTDFKFQPQTGSPHKPNNYCTRVAPGNSTKAYENESVATENVVVYEAPANLEITFAIHNAMAGISVTRYNQPILLALVAGNSCNISAEHTLFVLPADTNSTQMLLPQSQEANVTLCASTPLTKEQQQVINPEDLVKDRNIFLYSFMTRSVEPYALYYDALVVNRTTTISFDKRITSTTNKIAFAEPNIACTSLDDTTPAYDVNKVSSVTRNFSAAGEWSLCAKFTSNTPQYQQLRTLKVNNVPELSSRVILANITAYVNISNAPAKSQIILTNATECTPDAMQQGATLNISSTTDESGRAQLMTCGAQSEQPLRLCVTYTGYKLEDDGTSTSINTMLDCGDNKTVAIKSFAIASDKVMQGKNVRVFVNMAKEQLPSNVHACLAAKDNNKPDKCEANVTAAQLSYATFDLSSNESNYLYMVSDSCSDNYSRSSNTVTALSPLTVKGALIADVPGALTFNGNEETFNGLHLNQFVLVDDGSNACNDVTSSTDLPVVTVTPSSVKTTEFVSNVIVVTKKPSYSVCFIVKYPLTAERGSDDAGKLTVYVSAGVVTVEELTLKSAYAFIGKTNRFTFSPTLPSTIASSKSTSSKLGTTFCLTPRVGLTGNITSYCNSGPTCYETGPETSLSSSVSTGLYYVCVNVSTGGKTWTVGANSPLNAVQPWSLSLAIDGVLRQYVPFYATVTCTADDKSSCNPDSSSRGATPASQGSRGISYSGDSTSQHSASTQATTTYKLYVQRASASCYDISTSASGGTSTPPDTATLVVIEQPDAIVNVTFCLVINDVDVLPLQTETLFRYLEPSVIVANEKTDYTAGVPDGNEYGILTSDKDCKKYVTDKSPTTNMAFNLTYCSKDTDFSGSVVYYCQGVDGNYKLRAKLPVLYRAACASPKMQASIANVTAMPGTRITDFGLSNSPSMTQETQADATSGDESVLTDPRLYFDDKCENEVKPNSTITTQSSTVATQPVYIFVPKFEAEQKLFVCARVRYAEEGAPRFTTTSATLSVANWSVTPKAALSPLSSTASNTTATQLCITSAVHTQSPFISDDPQCKNNNGTVNNFTVSKDEADSDSDCGKGLPPSVTYKLPNINRFMYVCAYKRNQTQGNDATNNDVVAIARFLSVTAPAVTQYTPIIMRGAPFSATVLTPDDGTGHGPIYTMHDGSSSTPDYRKYFVNPTNRSVYLSTERCTSSLTTMTTVNDKNEVVINNIMWASDSAAQSAKQLALCTYTPAGVATALMIEKTNRNVWPAHYTTGTNATMYIPLFRDTDIVVVLGKDCSKIDSPLRNRTDTDGYMRLRLVNENDGAVQTGNYTVCRLDGSNYVYVDIVAIDPVYYYDVRGTTFVTNVNGSAELLKNLTSDKLLPGFSTSNTCDTGALHKKSNWTKSTESNQTIYVMGTETATGLHLCANLPNGTVALPMADGSFTFASSTLTSAFNNTLNWCALPTFPSGCYAPGQDTTMSDAELVVISGDCCTARGDGDIDTASVLARNKMNHGECSAWQFGDATTASQPPPQNTMVSVCAWSNSNDKYCPTIARVPLNTTNCANRDVAGGSSLLPGWLIAVIVLSIIIGLLLIALLIYLLCVFCCRPRRRGAAMDKDRQLVALRQMEASEYDYSMGADYYSVMGTNGGAGFGGSNWGVAGGVNNSSSSAVGGSRHPLLYYPAAGGAAGFAGSDGDSSSSPTSASAMRGIAGSSIHHVHTQEQQDNVHAGGGGSYSYHHQLQAANGTSLGMNTMTTNASASMATRPSLVEGFEDEERDEVALQEARERYHMRVAFAEELERLRLLAKEAEVIVGYEDTDERLFGHAAPELRSVEVLDVGTSGVTLTQRQQHSMAHGSEGEAVVDVFAGGVDVRDGAHNDNDDDDAFAPLNFDHHNGLTRDSATSATADAAATTAAARVRGGGGGGASDVDSDASVSQLARMLGGDGGAFNGNENGNESNNAAADTTATSQDKARARSSSSSPSSSGRHSHIHFDTAAQPSRNGSSNTTSRPLPSNNKDDIDDDDMDELSFTTTQRFYDEKRFLLEQEDIRRQRLSNWEDEERAMLAQDELNDYMQVATTMTANDSGNTNNTSALTAERAVARTVNVDEVVYNAPHTPTQPPQLTNETVTAVEKAQHRSSRRRRSHHGGSRTSDGRRRSSRGSRSGGGGSTTLGSIDQLDEELYPEHNTV